MNTYVLSIIAVVSLTTILIRFLPFICFRKKTPKIVEYLGDFLPYAIMAMLVVYCLKDTDFTADNHGLAEIISVAAVITAHKIKHNTLLSILIGTALYMILIRINF